MILRDGATPAGRDLGPASPAYAESPGGAGSLMIAGPPPIERAYPRCGRGGCEQRLTNCYVHRPREFKRQYTKSW